MKNNSLRKKTDAGNIIFIAILSLWGVVLLYPFYNSLIISLVPQEIYIKTPFLLYPKNLSFASYAFILEWNTIMSGFKTTIFVTVLGTAYNILLTVAAAYALTKPMPGRKAITYIILLTMYLQGGLIPYYLLVRGLGLRDSIAVMIIPTGISIMYMLIMRSYFFTIPAEIEESAKIDGANDFIILFRIILPLCLPMLATIALYYAVDRWNEWWHGMLFITKVEKQPLQLMVRNMLQASTFITQFVPDSARRNIFPQGIQMAAVMVSMVPIICVYPFLQKYFVKGLVIGGVKM